MNQPDRPFADEPIEVLQTAFDLANRHAEQAARFRPAQDGDPLPAVAALLKAELQQRSQTLPPPQGPEYTPCACSHIEPEHDINGRWCAMDACPCNLYRPTGAAAQQPSVAGADLRDRIIFAIGEHTVSECNRCSPDEDIADAVVARLPAPDNRAAVLSDTDRQFLTYALDLAADQMASRGEEFGDEDQAALDSLRRLAGEAQQDEAPGGVRCGCPSEDAVEHQFGSEGCDCIPFTRQTNPPRYLNRPTDTVDMISGWERGRHCPHHPAAVARPGQPETNNDDNPPVQCWHTEPNTPCDWNVCRQPERLAAGDRGTDPANKER